MVTAVDFLPWLRPSNDRYHNLVFNQLRELMAAGGYRTKFACSEPAFDPGDDLSGHGLFTRDSYIYIRPGSYVFGLSMWLGTFDGLANAWEPVTGSVHNTDVGYSIGTCVAEVECIDTNTGEAWWRSSQDVSTLGFADYQDTMQVIDSAGDVFADQFGSSINSWYLPDRRLCLGEGAQQVRFTSNSPNAAQFSFQIMFHLAEPIDKGVNSGI